MLLCPGGLLGYKRAGGPTYFFGSKILTSCFFFGSEKSARIFLGSNFRQANSSYAIQANRVILGSKMSSLVFFWVHNLRYMYFFGCKILGSVGPPPSRLYLSNPPGLLCPTGDVCLLLFFVLFVFAFHPRNKLK